MQQPPLKPTTRALLPPTHASLSVELTSPRMRKPFQHKKNDKQHVLNLSQTWRTWAACLYDIAHA